MLISPIMPLKLAAMEMSLERSQNEYRSYQAFHRSTNPENVVKIGPVDSENTYLVGRPLKD